METLSEMLSYILANRSQAADKNDLKKDPDILNDNILKELQYNIKSFAKVNFFFRKLHLKNYVEFFVIYFS